MIRGAVICSYESCCPTIKKSQNVLIYESETHCAYFIGAGYFR